MHKSTFNGNECRKLIHSGRRVGRPRLSSTEETIKEAWDHIKKDRRDLRYIGFDDGNNLIMEVIEQYADEETNKTPHNNIA